MEKIVLAVADAVISHINEDKAPKDQVGFTPVSVEIDGSMTVMELFVTLQILCQNFYKKLKNDLG